MWRAVEDPDTDPSRHHFLRSRQELEDVEDALCKFDKPSNVHESAKDYYREALYELGLAGVLLIVISVVMALALPSDGIWLIELGTGVAAALSGVGGLVDFKRGWDCEQKVDDLIDDYKHSY